MRPQRASAGVRTRGGVRTRCQAWHGPEDKAQQTPRNRGLRAQQEEQQNAEQNRQRQESSAQRLPQLRKRLLRVLGLVLGQVVSPGVAELGGAALVEAPGVLPSVLANREKVMPSCSGGGGPRTMKSEHSGGHSGGLATVAHWFMVEDGH